MFDFFKNIVTQQLCAAPDGPAKRELIEELAENLTCRYQDLMASGMEESEARTRALETLGDTAELVEYLKSLEPDQPLPELVTDPEKTDDGRLEELLRNVEELIRNAVGSGAAAEGGQPEETGDPLADIGQRMADAEVRIDALRAELRTAEEGADRLKDARDSLESLRDQVDVAGALEELARKLEEEQARIEAKGAELKELEEAYAALEAEFAQRAEGAEPGPSGWEVSMGYDGERRKFYAGKNQSRAFEVGSDDIKNGLQDLMQSIESVVQEAVNVAADAARKAADTINTPPGEPVDREAPIGGDRLRAIEVETAGGDITVRMTQPADGDVVISTDSDEQDRLEVFRTADGVLTIRPVRTETFAFFSRRGMYGASVDVTLDLPCRDWDYLKLRTTGGDVELSADRTIGSVSVTTVSGDVTGAVPHCPQVCCRTTNGDIRWTGQCAEFTGETVSGDVRFTGQADRFRVKTTSGDGELDGGAVHVSARTVSGELWLRNDLLPETMTLGTVSGDMRLELPDGEPFALHFSSTSGHFTSDFFTGSMGGRSCRFNYRGGGGRLYTASSVSGDLELRKG